MKRLFLAATLVALGVTAVFALWVTPPRENQGFDAVRLLYLHVPTAWVAYLAFGVTALASVLWLIPRTRDPAWDLLAGASAEVGVVFTGLTLVIGSLWGKPTWGTWWEWDARLTTTASTSVNAIDPSIRTLFCSLNTVPCWCRVCHHVTDR